MADYAPALAKLAVGVGANLAPGQTVMLNGKVGQEDLVRAVAAAAYDAGAHQVEVHYADPHVQLARLEHAPDEPLGSVIPWVRERPGRLAEMKGCDAIMLALPQSRWYGGLLSRRCSRRLSRLAVVAVLRPR